MAARKKAKAKRRAGAKKGRKVAKGAAARTAAKKKSAAPKAKKRAVAKKRAAPRAPQVETVIVDTVEEPAPGVVVVSEYQAVLQRVPKPSTG